MVLALLLDGFIRVSPLMTPPRGMPPRATPTSSPCMMEPIQGEGGLHPMRKEYLQQARALCDAKGWLLIIG